MRKLGSVRKPRVAYWTNIPTPYVQDRFNALAGRNTLDFEAWFMSNRESNRSWEICEADWEFKYRYLRGVGAMDARFSIPADLFTNPPDVLVSIYAQTAFVVSTLISRFRGIRHALYVEKTFENWVPRRQWKENLKKALFTRADGILAAGSDARSYAASYGAQESRIFEVWNCSNIGFYSAGSQLGDREKKAVHLRLELQGIVYLFVGRLWSGKGLFYLLDAYADVQRRLGSPSTLLLVGDGRDEQALKAYAGERLIHNVRFLGFRQRADMPEIYAASDVFVFPTLGDTYGTVVDEAMACGLPVISSSTCGEITSRLDHNFTGFLVPPRDSAALADRMIELGLSKELRDNMGQAAKAKIAPRTSELWADQFETAIAGILAGESSRGDT